MTGYRVHAIDGEIGHIENLMIDDADWSVHYLIVDTRNWWFGKRVLISPLAVKAIDWFDRHVELKVSRELVKASPPWDPLVAFNEEYAKRLHKHYGWPGAPSARVVGVGRIRQCLLWPEGGSSAASPGRNEPCEDVLAATRGVYKRYLSDMRQEGGPPADMPGWRKREIAAAVAVMGSNVAFRSDELLGVDGSGPRLAAKLCPRRDLVSAPSHGGRCERTPVETRRRLDMECVGLL